MADEFDALPNSAYQRYSHSPHVVGARPQLPVDRAPALTPRNGLGIASLVVAVVALLSVWSVLGGIVLGIIGAWLGFSARGRVARGEANNDAVAVAGVMLGIVSIVVALLFIPVWVGLMQVQLRENNYHSCMAKAGSDKTLQRICTH
ncbi:hypothetical protein A5647_12380 [Mycobacterium sp. 1100029.7]|nr:hypothetical protein A5647_12380 [Mycobacterium sp. 1100029.7]